MRECCAYISKIIFIFPILLEKRTFFSFLSGDPNEQLCKYQHPTQIFDFFKFFFHFVHFLDEQLYWLNFECQCALLQRTGLALYSFVKMCCKVHSQQKHITNSKVSRNPDPADPLVNHLPSYSYILFVILNYNGIIGIAYLQEYRT